MADTAKETPGGFKQDEKWVEIQKKTFTRWMNTFLKERLLKCDDLAVDLKSGVLLINLLEIISSKTVATKYTKQPKIKTQMLENNSYALNFLTAEGIKLVNIGNQDIVDSNLKLILGLIWTIILRYHINIEQGKSARSDLLKWVQSKIPEYNITNFTSNWNDGRAICGLADAVLPGTYPNHRELDPKNALFNATSGTDAAETKMGIPKVLAPEDMISTDVDELSVMTYISYFRDWEGSEGRRREAERIERTPVPAKCRAFGPGLERAETFQPTQFTIEAINANNRRVPCGGAPFQVNIQGPKGAVPFELVDENNGLYQVSYTPNDAGKLVVTVTLNDIGIQGNPWTVPVTRTGPDASKCRAYGPGLEGGVAGEKAPFTIEAVGPTGQKLSDGGDPFEVKATGPHGPAKVDLVDNKDGTYAASYLPLDPGPYKVEVSLNGKPIANSPFSVNIDKNPNEADASKCKAYGPGLEGGNTAEPAVFFVEVNTPSGNRYTGPDPPVGVDITDPSGNVVQAEKATKEPGVLQFTYAPKDAGTYKVEVIVRNKFNPTFYEHVPGSPFSVPIAAGTDANNTIAYGPGVEGPVLDTEPTHFTIEARDNKGNKLPKGGDPFEVTVAGPNGNVPAKVTDNNDGTYKVEYAANEPGPHKVNVALKGKPIKNAPFTVNVDEGADADHSCMETYTFTIRAKSKRGGNLTTGGNRFTVNVDGPKGANPTTQVVDHQNGLYTVSYTLPEAGTYKIGVKVNGKHIAGSPWKQEQFAE